MITTAHEAARTIRDAVKASPDPIAMIGHVRLPDCPHCTAHLYSEAGGQGPRLSACTSLERGVVFWAVDTVRREVNAAAKAKAKADAQAARTKDPDKYRLRSVTFTNADGAKSRATIKIWTGKDGARYAERESPAGVPEPSQAEIDGLLSRCAALGVVVSWERDVDAWTLSWV